MSTAEIILELRKKNALSQEEMAEKLCVTRQAVSRWETGETVPNSDLLKIIARTFGLSIDILLGQPRNLACQVCGMPLDNAENLSRERDGAINGKYCKWCYVDGVHKYSTMEAVIEDVVPNMDWGTPQQRREFLQKQLPTLEYWRRR